MVNEEILKRNAAAAQGLKLLAQSGALKECINDLILNSLEGDPDEPPVKIIERVRAYRRTKGFLLQLQEIGESLLEEQGNEPQ